MYIGHARLCVCLIVCLSVRRRIPTHYCTDPYVSWRNGRGCSLVVRYWADLQPVHGFRCYDDIVRRARNVSGCTRSMPGLVSLTVNLQREAYYKNSDAGRLY